MEATVLDTLKEATERLKARNDQLEDFMNPFRKRKIDPKWLDNHPEAKKQFEQIGQDLVFQQVGRMVHKFVKDKPGRKVVVTSNETTVDVQFFEPDGTESDPEEILKS